MTNYPFTYIKVSHIQHQSHLTPATHIPVLQYGLKLIEIGTLLQLERVNPVVFILSAVFHAQHSA
jgi:hypothetical protein